MYGRYGGDKLSMVIIVTGFILSIAGMFFYPISIAAYVLYIYVIFRAFSKNIPARQKEYYAFLKIWQPFTGWFSFQKRKLGERNLYKYFKCPNCRQQLRAPKGRGKIMVTCQKCHKQFQTKV